MDALRQNLRYALRQLAGRPTFTAVVVVTLALGIGANTAIFSVIDGVLLRPPPVDDPDGLVVVWETDRNSGTTREPASVPDYLDFRQRSRRLARLGAFEAGETNLQPETGDPVRVPALQVTAGLLPTLGIEPIAGRSFTFEDDVPGSPDVALIGEELWTSAFQRSPEAVGATITLNDVTVTVVGVLPSSADFGMLQILDHAAYSRGYADRASPGQVGIWTPLRPDYEASPPRQTHPILMLGRLSPEATPAEAQQELATIAADLEATYPENEGRGIHVEPLEDVVFGRARPALLVLLAAVGLVLLAACVNVANLLLARGAERGREVAVRRTLGARTAGLARQYLVEGTLLALAGGTAGVVVAFGALDGLLALAPRDLPRVDAVAIDLRVLGVALAVSLAVGMVFGLIPTLQARGISLQPALQASGGRGATGGRGLRRLQSGLVVAQLVFAVLLVVGAGLLVRSLQRLHAVDPGFRTEGVLKAEYQLPASRYPRDLSTWPEWTEMHRFNDQLLRRVGRLPGAVAVAVAGNHPLDPGFTNSFSVVGREAEAADWPEISVRRVTPGYFEAVGLDVARGRPFREADGPAEPPVAAINRAAAERFFQERDPLGHEINMWGAARTIVGVVADERFHGVDEPAPPGVYLPLAQAPSANGAHSLLIRTEGGGGDALVGPVRTAIQELDPGLAVFGVETLQTTVSRSLGQRGFTTLLLGAFAALALLLGAVGIAGVIGYAVSRREREIGIRMALGARPGDVVRRFLGEGARLAAVGTGLGLLGALATTRLLSSLLYGVSTIDPVTYLAAPLVLGAVALLASWIPARRATRVDPMNTLRAE